MKQGAYTLSSDQVKVKSLKNAPPSARTLHQTAKRCFDSYSSTELKDKNTTQNKP